MAGQDDKEYQEYLAWANQQVAAQRQQALQKAGPQPYAPAENQDIPKLQSGQITQDPQSRAPASNRGALRQAADIATATATGIGQGAAFGHGRQLEDWEQDAQTEHPTATGLGRLLGSTGSSYVLGSGVGQAVGGLGGLAKTAGKYAIGQIPGGNSLMNLFKAATSAAPEAATGAAETAAPVAQAASQTPVSGSLGDALTQQASPTSVAFKSKIKGL